LLTPVALLRVAAVLAVLLVVPGLFEAFEAPKAAMLRVTGIAVLAGVAVASLRLDPRPRAALDTAVAAWLLAEVAATLASESIPLSFFGDPAQREGLLTSLGLAGLYAAARAHRFEWWGRGDGAPVKHGSARVASAAAGATAEPAPAAAATFDILFAAILVSCLYALVQAARLDPLPWGRVATYGPDAAWARPFGTLGHPNLLGAATGAALCLGVARSLAQPARRWLDVPALALLAATTLLTFSRGAWLGTAAGLVVVAALVLRSGGVAVSRRGWIVGGLVVLAAAAMFVAGGWSHLFTARFAELVSPSGGSGASRIEIWRGALAAWWARPWLGFGPDTFALVFPRYQTAEYWRLEWGGLPIQAHSVYLHTLATRGVVGLLALIGLGAAFAADARRAWRSPAAPRLWVAGLAGAAAAVAVTGAFGAVGVVGALWLMILAGVTASAGEAGRDPARQRTDSPRVPRAALMAGAVAGVLVLAYSVAEGLASLAGALATHQTYSNPSLAERAAARATRLAPWQDEWWRGLAEARLALSERDRAPAHMLGHAERAIGEALRRTPKRAVHHQRLGAVLAARGVLGDTAAARAGLAAYDRSIALSAVNGQAMVERSRVGLRLGNTAEARASALAAAALYPGDALAWSALANAEVTAGRLDSARTAIARALAADWHRRDSDRARAEQVARWLGVPLP
jgi:O-antigen ligase